MVQFTVSDREKEREKLFLQAQVGHQSRYEELKTISKHSPVPLFLKKKPFTVILPPYCIRHIDPLHSYFLDSAFHVKKSS